MMFQGPGRRESQLRQFTIFEANACFNNYHTKQQFPHVSLGSSHAWHAQVTSASGNGCETQLPGDDPLHPV